MSRSTYRSKMGKGCMSRTAASGLVPGGASSSAIAMSPRLMAGLMMYGCARWG